MDTALHTATPPVFADQVRVCLLDAKPLSEARADWDRVLGACANVPVAYTSEMVEYQAAYMAETGQTDLSLVLYNDRSAVAVWPLSLHRSNGAWVLGSQDAAVRPPLFADSVTENTRKTLGDRCLALLESLAVAFGIDFWNGTSSPRGAALDTWHRRVMERGATASVGHELWIDLSLPLETIRAGIRKSFRPLISKGLRLWTSSLSHGSLPPGEFEEFRQFHIQVAGRETRSKHTWDLQEQMVLRKQAFLVVLRNTDGRMVAGGLFHHSQTEAFYGVGVYDRDLFDLPLGHLVQMKAIEHLKELGLKWYFLGHRPYPSDIPAPTAKELSISHFKEGFATSIFAGLKTVCPLRKTST